MHPLAGCSYFTSFNVFTLRVVKTGLMILEIFHSQSHFLENSWRRNVDHRPNNNSPSTVLWTIALLISYFQKYESSRRYVIWSVDGLTPGIQPWQVFHRSQVRWKNHISFTLPMLRLLLSKAQRCKDFWKPSKPSRVGWVLLDKYPFARVSVIFQVFCIILHWQN